jgi:hypothetical protein
MTRHPGLVVATVFAVGAFLGLTTSALFLDVDETAIRSTAEAHVSAAPGPLVEMVLGALDERDVFGRVADDVRADQIRNLRVAGVGAALVAVGLGVTVGRRERRSAVLGRAADDSTDRPVIERQM